MRSVVAVSAVLSVGLVAAPATAAAPSQIIPVGKAVIRVDDGCLARVIAGKYKKSVPATGKMVLPTGRYRLIARPGTCKVSKKKLRVRKGKTVRAKVRNSDQPEPAPSV